MLPNAPALAPRGERRTCKHDAAPDGRHTVEGRLTHPPLILEGGPVHGIMPPGPDNLASAAHGRVTPCL
jgi:hypothetical protein